MFPIHIEVDKSQGSFVDLTVREQRRILKETMGDTGTQWRDEMLMRHFRPGAAIKYRYRARTAKTIRRKKQLAARGKVEAGGRLFLVWSGLLRRAMRARHRVRPFPTRATVNLVGPSYFHIKRKAGHPNLGEEVTTVTSEEEQQLASSAEENFAEHLKTAKPRKRRKKLT